jgi:hypothetical protein
MIDLRTSRHRPQPSQRALIDCRGHPALALLPAKHLAERRIARRLQPRAKRVVVVAAPLHDEMQLDRHAPRCRPHHLR